MPIPSAFADMIAFFPTIDSYGGCWFPGIRTTQFLAIRCYQGGWREWPTPGDTPAIQFAEFRGRMYARAASLLVSGADGWAEVPTAPYLSAIAAQQDRYLWIATSFDGLWRSPDGVAGRPVPSPSPPGTVAHGWPAGPMGP